MKILMLSCTFPYPPSRGGTPIRTFNLMRYLSQRHSVTVVTQRAADVTDEEIEALRQYVDKLVVFPRPREDQSQRDMAGKLKRFGQFLIEGTPPSVMSIYSSQMQQWIDQAVESGAYDAITCEHSVNEIYVRPEWQQQLTTVVDVHSSVYATCKEQLATGTAEKPLRDRLNRPLLYRYEQRYCNKFSVIVATTEEDGEQLKSFYTAAELAVIPYGVELELFHYWVESADGHQL
ncbi:MAG: glycosyltransferase, partial [Microcoleaceae cyanobacterium]